tara:strand:- start:1665 stop:2156 length:492 start_codon:yes stop_codon:yes gene_type:complete
MKKIILKLVFFTLLVGCSNFEFVYNDASKSNLIKDETLLAISGDETEIIYSYAINKINNKKNDYTYELSIISTKVVEAVVVEKDATASKFNIELTIFYSLENAKNNCMVLEKSFTTNSTFDSKSAGYSFGTDLSEQEVLIQSIHSNIDDFLLHLNGFEDRLNC